MDRMLANDGPLPGSIDLLVSSLKGFTPKRRSKRNDYLLSLKNLTPEALVLNSAGPGYRLKFKDLAPFKVHKNTAPAATATSSRPDKGRSSLAYLMTMSCADRITWFPPHGPAPGTSISQADGSCLPNMDLCGESSDSLLNLQDMHITN